MRRHVAGVAEGGQQLGKGRDKPVQQVAAAAAPPAAPLAGGARRAACHVGRSLGISGSRSRGEQLRRRLGCWAAERPPRSWPAGPMGVSQV